MKSLMAWWRSFVWLALGVGFGQGALRSESIPIVSHVVHISVDGLASVHLWEIMTHGPAQFPSFWQLVTNGASTFNARCDYDSSVTMPNHTCMFTGRPVLQPSGMPETTHHGFEINFDDTGTLHTSGNPYLSYQASTFDVAHDHSLSTALLASKAKFEFYARTWNAEHGAPDLIGEDNGTAKIDYAQFTEGSTNPPMYEMSAPLVDALLDGLTNAGWNYSFLHFSETDSTGHVYGWASEIWSNSVRHVDFQLSRILGAIQSSATLSRSTVVIITADHGGIEDRHGFPDEPWTYIIPIFVWGNGIPHGTDVYALFTNRTDPGPDRIDYISSDQPLRNGDTGNLAMALLGLPPVPGSMMRPELASMAFNLAIEPSNGKVTVSWPVAAADYALEAADTCLPDSDWQAITSGINIVGPRYVYSVSASSAPAQFFRLSK